MRRFAITIAVLLLTGAVLNAVVSLAISALAGAGDEREIPVERVETIWSRYRWQTWATVPTSSNSYVSPGTRLLVAGGRDDTGSICLAYEAACGFPAKCLAYGFTLDHGRGVWRIHDCLRVPWNVKLVMFNSARNHLPYRVLPLAFAANMAFYAILLWLLACGPFALRRLMRVRRGLCPKCAYPVGRTTVCTECGQTLCTRAVA